MAALILPSSNVCPEEMTVALSSRINNTPSLILQCATCLSTLTWDGVLGTALHSLKGGGCSKIGSQLHAQVVIGCCPVDCNSSKSLPGIRSDFTKTPRLKLQHVTEPLATEAVLSPHTRLPTPSSGSTFPRCGSLKVGGWPPSVDLPSSSAASTVGGVGSSPGAILAAVGPQFGGELGGPGFVGCPEQPPTTAATRT